MIDDRRLILLILCCFISTNASTADLPSVAGGLVPKGANRELPPWVEIGRNVDDPANLWIGLDKNQRFALPGVTKIKLASPENWLPFYGLRLNLKIPKGRTFNGVIRLHTPLREAKSSYRTTSPVTTSATFSVVGDGHDVIDLPFSAFNHFYPFADTFRNIVSVELRGSFADDKPGSITLQRVRVISAPVLKIYSEARSRAANAGKTVEYDLQVMNCTDRVQAIVLSHHPYSKHVMHATVAPGQLQLQPGETKSCKAAVTISSRVPPGGRERQKIVAVANGRWGGEVELISACQLPHPYLVHTPERWQAVRNKIEKYDWAREELRNYLNTEVKQRNQFQFWKWAVAWQITRKTKYAQLARPGVRFDLSGKDLIQAVEIYDMIADSGIFSADEQDRIRREMRQRMHSISLSGVANLELQEARCGFTLALAVQDFAWFEYFFYGADGVYDNIANGIMPDGWWYEGSANYNIWVSRYICKMALAAEPFGVNMIDGYFTPGYSKEFRRLTDDAETRKREFGGKPFQKFGKHSRPRITLDMLWDSFVDHMAHDGQIYAANDSGEVRFADSEAFELAYMMWPKPEYASLIKYGGNRNLLYGVPELPKDTPSIGTRSAYSDGIGLITLRSQTPVRHPSKQIEVSLKYGTHGAYHGHFDRCALNSLRRYDRNLYTSGHGLWYSYASFMYGMFVQSSVNHNMVVVDGKNQESVESRRLLFHSGPKMQVAAVETNARWSNPPYLGLQMGRSNRKKGETAVLSGEERLAAEDVFMPVPKGGRPEVASIGEWTERVRQRRAVIVTDHYVVLADSLRGEQPHTFDNLLQIRGFQNITGGNLSVERHADQMETNPLLAGQLISNCRWWTKNGTSKSRFRTIYDDRSSLNWRTLTGVKGDLFVDVYSAWPKQAEVMVGAAPEYRARAGWSQCTVSIDGDVKDQHEFSPYILGRHAIDLEIPTGAKTLTLKSANQDRRQGGGFVLTKGDCLFWGGGQLKLADGQSIPFSQLQKNGRLKLNGIRTHVDGSDAPIRSGQDYGGGPVVIAGRPYSESLPAQPSGVGEVTVDLTDLGATRLRVDFGADYPQGRVAKYQRCTYSARTKGKTARFLTVIEPFEKTSDTQIQSVEAMSDHQVQIQLSNGCVDEITVQELDGEHPKVTIKKTFRGETIIESTQSAE